MSIRYQIAKITDELGVMREARTGAVVAEISRGADRLWHTCLQPEREWRADGAPAVFPPRATLKAAAEQLARWGDDVVSV